METRVVELTCKKAKKTGAKNCIALSKLQNLSIEKLLLLFREKEAIVIIDNEEFFVAVIAMPGETQKLYTEEEIRELHQITINDAT